MAALSRDTRAVSEVVGAVIIFGFLIIALSTYQAVSVPAQNADIEFEHYGTIQDDLTELQSAMVTAAESGTTRSVPLDLGPEYPPRIVAINGPPAAGQLRTESVGTGNITSSSIGLNSLCRLKAGTAEAVPTQRINYQSGYNYFEGGNLPNRIEQTVLYQASPPSGGVVTRTDQSFVDTTGRTVSLYPVTGTLQASGTQTTAVRVVGGYSQSRTVSDGTVTIPTALPATVWRAQLNAAESEITVTDTGENEVTVTFSGDWTFQCTPVGLGSAPDQLPTAAAGPDSRVTEGSTVALDGTASEPRERLTYDWTFSGSPPAGVELVDEATPTPIVDASAADVSSATPVDIQLEVGDTDGNTDTDTVTVEVLPATGGSDGSGGSGETPSLVATVENLQTDASPTQNITFTPTVRTVPSTETRKATITIDLSNADGGTSGNPDPVKYGEGSVSVDHPGDISIVENADTYFIEFTPSSSIATSQTVQVQITNVKTQVEPQSDIQVPVYRSDGDGDTPTFSLTDSGSGGSNVAQNVEISQVQINGNNAISVTFRNNNPSAVEVTRARLDDYTQANPPQGEGNRVDRVGYDSDGDLGEGATMFTDVSGPTIGNNGGSQEVVLTPKRNKNKAVDAEQGDELTFTIEFADGSQREYTITL